MVFLTQGASREEGVAEYQDDAEPPARLDPIILIYSTSLSPLYSLAFPFWTAGNSIYNPMVINCDFEAVFDGPD
jgi:hypothetical protein